MSTPSPRQGWTQTNNKNQRAMEAAQTILRYLDDPDVQAALAGKRCTRGHITGYEYDTYLLAPDAATPPPVGRQLLATAAAGRPVRGADLYDLVMGIIPDIKAYAESYGEFSLPKKSIGGVTPDTVEQHFELIVPATGSTSYHAPRLERKADGSPVNAADEKGPTPRYLDADQRAALNAKLEPLSESARIFLGNVQVAWR